jgi:Domain of Unknown Function (DUF1540)
MNQVVTKMSPVAACSATECAYNVSKRCHAKAITVGDVKNPECDTFLRSELHNREAKRVAGVGACKVRECKFNDDFECTADSVQIGVRENRINCLTFSETRAASENQSSPHGPGHQNRRGVA